jgi:hypothetical protein
MVVQDERKSGEQRNFRYSEWGPEAALSLCKEVAHLPCPYGGTLGEVIDKTAKDQITKVMLEEKVYGVHTHPDESENGGQTKKYLHLWMTMAMT